MCEGASKQSPDFKYYTAPGQRPPVFKFLDPPLNNIFSVEGASKQSPDFKYYTAPGQRPPVFKFLDPPLNNIFSVVDTLDLWMKCIKQRIIYMYILVQ